MSFIAARHHRLAMITALIGCCAEARVIEINISSRVPIVEYIGGPAALFGSVGAYEKIRGSVHFSVDPTDWRNSVIFDLDKALRTKDGSVRFAADFMLLKPVEKLKGSNVLFVDVNNRGRVSSLREFNDIALSDRTNDPTTRAQVGNGFLMTQGYTLAWVGWESDITPADQRFTVNLPIASQNGVPLQERIILEFSDTNLGAGPLPFTLPLSGSPLFKSYSSVSTDPAEAGAILRSRPSDSSRPGGPEIPEGQTIPDEEWSFADCPTGPPGTPSRTHICLKDGFRNDLVYELTYKATDSPVSGLGHATTRDFVSFLINAAGDEAGNPNPVQGLKFALGFGGSSSGMYLRDYIYQGFNEDEHGRQVFAGVMIHSAGVNKLGLNYRFAQPNPFSTQHQNRYVPDGNFPRHYGIRANPMDAKDLDGILKRPSTDPKVFHVDHSGEYWDFRASLVSTDEGGETDVIQPADVRVYMLASTQHFNFKGAPQDRGTGDRKCQQWSNPVNVGSLGRALLVALEQWVESGVSPPPSTVPTVWEGTLVDPAQSSTGFPSIPGVTYNGVFNGSGERDFGPRVHQNSGVVDILRPEPLRPPTVLVPKVDSIGNDIAGIRHPFVGAPTATLTGWSLRTPEFQDGDFCELKGMSVPLATTAMERLATGDPRPSLEELYGDHDGYIAAVRAAAEALVSDSLLLASDAKKIIDEASQSNVLK